MSVKRKVILFVTLIFVVFSSLRVHAMDNYQGSVDIRNSNNGGLSSLASADLNNDGRLDVVAIDYHFDQFTVHINKGRGIFSKVGTYPTGDGPKVIGTLDLNADGYRDVVIANERSEDLTAYMGDGSGSFLAVSALSVDSRPSAFAIGKFNDDKYDDVVVANYGSDNITVLLGNGFGGFSTKNIFIGAGTCPSSIIAEHFNRGADNYLDLAVKGYCDKSIHVLLGDGKGSFSKSHNIPQY